MHSLKFNQMSLDDIRSLEIDLSSYYDELRSKEFKLDLTRGKPSPDQLALSNELDRSVGENYVLADGTDVRNYGVIDGIPEARRLGAKLLGVRKEEILVGGNASLTLMYQYLLNAWLHGPLGSNTAWRLESHDLKFLCIVPGYDRHFTITEDLGFQMINVAMQVDGPNMDEIEELISKDPSIKGIWCVPKHQNPTGYTFSEETVRRFSRLAKLAGPGFRIMWDNAYAVHDLYADAPPLPNIMDYCRNEKTENSIAIFGSTSKITRAGSGIAFFASSPENLSVFRKHLSVQTIGPDKLNQLRHIRFLKDLDGIIEHMRRHAKILRPKFEKALTHLDKDLRDIATWTRPKGGYFLSVDTPAGTASEVVRLAGDAGVKLTPAGATFPYRHDPNDSNIRLAPTYPSLNEIDQAMSIFVTTVKLAAVRQRLVQG
jgi:DNA-binding transcriptional MocR family regulator